MGTWRPSLAQEIRLKDVKRRRPFFVTPYLLTGFNQLHELNSGENAYENHTDP